MFGIFKTIAAAGAIAASALMTTAAHADGWIVGLVDGKSIVTIDPASRKVNSTVNIRGAGMILGIDVRPADGVLYGVTSDGTVVAIDIHSGQATKKSKLTEAWKRSAATTFDFNPVADRLRLMSAEGVSWRINVDDGKVIVDGSHKFKDGDANAGRTPRIVAGAYTNSFKDTKATTLYNLDTATGTLVTQAPPNDGILNTVGSLGIPVTGAVAFNIVSSGPDQNAGWLVAGGSLYSVDLKTGKATMAGKISGLNGTLTDIAWMN
jgi:outer membrane protein assembly factor BamB